MRRIAGWTIVGLNVLVLTLLVLTPARASVSSKTANICQHLSCSGPNNCQYTEGWGCAIQSGGGACFDGPCNP